MGQHFERGGLLQPLIALGDQNEIRLQSTTYGTDQKEGRRISWRRKGIFDDFQELADRQNDLKRGMDNLFTQLGKLEKDLNPDQKERFRKAQRLCRLSRCLGSVW